MKASQIFRHILFIVCIAVFSLSPAFGDTGMEEIPVKDPVSAGATRPEQFRVTNLVGIDQLMAAVKDGNRDGLLFDLTGIVKTLGNTPLDGKMIYGDIYTGPYPFESKETEYGYKRYRIRSGIRYGKGILNIRKLIDRVDTHLQNSEDWTDRGTVSAKFVLYLEKEGKDSYIGNYEARISFIRKNGEFHKAPSIIEGPMVNLVHSDDPSQVVISFKTSEPVRGEVFLPGIGVFRNNGVTDRHEIRIRRLKADSEYRYRLRYGDQISGTFRFRTAPSDDPERVVFAYTGDSRAGIVENDEKLMGVNHVTLERLVNLAYRKKSALLLQGGDMINGYTASRQDFITQLHSWKNAITGFWRERPVYTCVGNHEALINEYILKNRKPVENWAMDKWPYATHSTEAVYGSELVQFTNGPEPSDPRRPAYRENVYSFRYGYVKFIVFNNNYWRGWMDFGGSPEGFIFDDQLNWIRNELAEAEKDVLVRYIVLFAQEPVFPNGGHVKDSMWYYGDNDVRGASWDPKTGKMALEKKGIIDVRNELVKMIDASTKVAAVLGSDEHAYHKVLIDKTVPVGIPGEKKEFSPLKDLNHATWYIVSGGAGAPYYSKEPTPWNRFWENHPVREEHNWAEKGAFSYSSQANIFIFNADRQTISMTVYNPYGEKIDFFPDLMAGRRALGVN